MNGTFKQWINWLIAPLPKVFKEEPDYSPINAGIDNIKKIAVSLLVIGVIGTLIWKGFEYLLTKKKKR